MDKNKDISFWTKNKKLITWVEEMKDLCMPDSVHICDGSQEENDYLVDLLIKQNKASQHQSGVL